jgi:REP element-mobilizing transposase RayT
MPFWRSYAHLIWTTKNREPLINAAMEDALYACLIAKAAELSCFVHAVGGVADHVHVVISIPPKHSVATVVKHLKGSSSHYVNHVLGVGAQPFAWQRGYGYLSLGESQCERAVAYVKGQKQHHVMDTVNSWLERVDEDNEEAYPSERIRVVRETQPTYLSDEFPS